MTLQIHTYTCAHHTLIDNNNTSTLSYTVTCGRDYGEIHILLGAQWAVSTRGINSMEKDSSGHEGRVIAKGSERGGGTEVVIQIHRGLCHVCLQAGRGGVHNKEGIKVREESKKEAMHHLKGLANGSIED